MALTRIKEEDLEITGVLGRGGFGIVLKCRHKTFLEDVALKCTLKITQRECERVKSEGSTMMKLHHSNILFAYGYLEDMKKNLFGLVMPYMKHGSVDSLSIHVNVPWALRLCHIYQTALGMEYLHSQGVLHMDLKAPNLLLDDYLDIKISDFGLALYNRETVSFAPGGEFVGAGSVTHMPPEYMDSSSVQAPSGKFDVYSYAIVIWEILTGRAPYEGAANMVLIMTAVIIGKRPRLDLIAADAPAYIKDIVIPLMTECWSQHPQIRPTFTDVLHKLKPQFDLLDKQGRADKDTVLEKLSSAKVQASLLKDVGIGDDDIRGLIAGNLYDVISKTHAYLDIDSASVSTKTFEEIEDRTRALCLGHAVGNALGLMTTHMRKDHVKKVYGNFAKLEYGLKVDNDFNEGWQIGEWVTDTDHLLILMASLIDLKGQVSDKDFAVKFKSYYDHGLKGMEHKPRNRGATIATLLSQPNFTQDPLQAAEDVAKGLDKSASNGALMRMSILGVHQFQYLTRVFENSVRICKATHGNSMCIAAVVAMNTTIALLLQRSPSDLQPNGTYNIDVIIKKSLKFAQNMLPSQQLRDELASAMNESTRHLASVDDPDKKCYVLTTLAVAYCALRQDDFRLAIQDIVMRGGDADTNAAVAGAMLGCKLGTKNIPESWKRGLRHLSILEDHIEKFIKILHPGVD